MGIWDAFTDAFEAVKPWSIVEAEAPAEEPKDDKPNDDEKAEEDDKKDVDDAEEKDADDKEEDEDEEEEEEEEEEAPDPKEKFEEECKESKQCHGPKHHFDECVERVTNASDDAEGEKEDCVEEFFHLAHCATQCAAPKLWSVLK